MEPRILAIAGDWKTGKARSPVRIVYETPVSATLDGGNNVGYIAAYRAAEVAIEKARRSGIAAVGAYNSAVASLESRVLPSARRFKELKAVPDGREIARIEQVELPPAPGADGPPLGVAVRATLADDTVLPRLQDHAGVLARLELPAQRPRRGPRPRVAEKADRLEQIDRPDGQPRARQRHRLLQVQQAAHPALGQL